LVQSSPIASLAVPLAHEAESGPGPQVRRDVVARRSDVQPLELGGAGGPCRPDEPAHHRQLDTAAAHPAAERQVPHPPALPPAGRGPPQVTPGSAPRQASGPRSIQAAPPSASSPNRSDTRQPITRWSSASAIAAVRAASSLSPVRLNWLVRAASWATRPTSS